MISESLSTLVRGGVLRVVINSFIRPVTETERNSIKLKKKNSNKDNLIGNQLQWIIRGAPADGYNKAYHLPFLTSSGSRPWAKGRGEGAFVSVALLAFLPYAILFFLTQNKRGRSATAYPPTPPFTLCPFYSSTLFLFLRFTECGSFNYVFLHLFHRCAITLPGIQCSHA